MGRIKELLEKKQKGEISDEELKELQELQAEAKDADGGAGNGDNGSSTTSDEEEKAIDELASTLATKVTEQISKGVEGVLKDLKPKAEELIIVKNEAKFIVDKKLGKKVSVQELSEIKVALPGREDKKVKEVSMKTVHFVDALLQNDVQKLQLLVEGTGSRGGFLVPEEFANVIIEDIRDVSIMRQLADVITTNSDTLHLPSLASRPRANWRSEGAVKATSTVDFGETVLTPYSLAVIVGLSEELVADAQLGVGNIINYVSQVMATSLAEKEEVAFWEGDGSGKPTGVDNYSLRTINAGLTDTSRADALIQAIFRTPQGYRNRGVWVMNSATMEKVATLKDSQNNYLMGTLGGGFTPTLRGRPVYEQNDIPGGKAFFGDFSYYKIVDRQGVTVDTSREATVAGQSAFERNLVYVRVEKRVDGELVLPAAVTEVQSLGNA